MEKSSPAPAPSRLKPLLDFGPLLVFFVVNAKWGLVAATGVLVPLSVLALAVTWRLEGRVAPLNLYGTLAVVVFGGLTVLLDDEDFVKIKLTVVYALLGGVLLVGLARGKSPIRALLGGGMRLSEVGWRRMTVNFTVFFFALAGLNEVLRRTLTSDAWAAFKVFGVPGALFVFTVLQALLLRKHVLDEPEA
jgi:intracellular septation protein